MLRVKKSNLKKLSKDFSKAFPWSWFLLSGLVFGLDQVTKFMAEAHLVYAEPYPVLPIFNLNLAYNTGAAFSFLSQAGAWHQWFFIVFSLMMSVVFVVWIFRLSKEAGQGAWMQLLALSFILGGTLGNLCDRFSHGKVVDFIQLYYKSYAWPVFNLADAAICLGAFFLFLDVLIDYKK